MIVVVVLFSSLLPPSGDDAALPSQLSLEEPAVSLSLVSLQGEQFHFGMTAALQGRVAIPLGAADRGDTFSSGNVIVIANRMSYLELFNPGLGFTLEADLMVRPPPPVPGGPPWERTPAMGGYVALEIDWFDGGSATDDFGTKVTPETLRLPQVYVGFKAEGTVQENFFGDVRVGFGAAHYPSLMAKIRPAGLPETDREFFQDRWTFAMELRMHFGWRAGPVAIIFGLGGRLIAPPTEGDAISMDPGAFWTLDFEAGVQIGF
ncbi:MAG TPA: hypothetical protein VE981_09060 [Planctomycetota bacterium]|nr:hypothetical protein [Planctomycetota bacterium]